MIKKIVVIGPESTGKSTLCSQLAEHYKKDAFLKCKSMGNIMKMSLEILLEH